MGRLFGTDGVRGVAISELTVELAMRIGRAAAITLAKSTHHKAKILIGKDTRVSGDVLESALVSGICSVGADVYTLGVIPTPAVAYLTLKYGADAGIVISASHNPFEFNGIKIFSSTGLKLPDEIEDEIERLVLDSQNEMLSSSTDSTGKVIPGRVIPEKNAEWDYVRHLLKNVDTDLSRMRIVVDCANGASSSCAEKFFKGLGANVILINNSPNGININDECGSTSIESLSKAVVEHRAHAGLAFDGDADRCLMVDEKGEPIDGDKMIAMLLI